LLDVSISNDGRDAVGSFSAKLDAAQAAGCKTLWIANHLFQRDPVALAYRALSSHPGLRVALMAMNPYTVHPVQAAMMAATLDECFPGRVILCLGVGAPVDLKSVNIEASGPLRAMREALAICRALLNGETVNVQGEVFSVANRKLPQAATVPLVLAASGPQMLALAGASADGVLMSAGSSVEFVRWSMDHVDQGAQGRKVRAHGLVYGAIDADANSAHNRLRKMLGTVLRGQHHAHNLQLAGSVLDQAALLEAMGRDDTATVNALINNDIVARHAVSGTPDQVRQRMEAYHQAGLDELVIAGAQDAQQMAALLQVAAR
jgi:5,10-methylenetetrahydromethanopterin reductase